MNIISLNLEALKKLEFSNAISTEGGLYALDCFDTRKIIKKLDFVGTPYYNNKLKIVLSLYKNKAILPKEFCIPEGLVESAGVISGFYLPFIRGDNLQKLLNSNDISHSKKIEYLKAIGNLLDKIKNLKVYLNDLHENNFMIDTDGNLRVIDLDSSVIGDAKPFASKYLTPFSLAAYIDKYKKVNDEVFGYIYPTHDTDLYCYIIVILNYLLGINVSSYNKKQFDNLLNCLNGTRIDKELIDIISLIVTEHNNINPVNYLDTITKKQVSELKDIKKQFLKR